MNENTTYVTTYDSHGNIASRFCMSPGGVTVTAEQDDDTITQEDLVYFAVVCVANAEDAIEASAPFHAASSRHATERENIRNWLACAEAYTKLADLV